MEPEAEEAVRERPEEEKVADRDAVEHSLQKIRGIK